MTKVSTNLGKVATTPKGEYSGSTKYLKLDVVLYNGSSYVCLKESTGNLPTDTEYWQLMASKGDTGASGQDGYTPVKGVDYFTAEDIASLNIPDDTADLTNGAGYITNAVSDLTNYYDKTTIDNKVSSVYKYKGSVATYADLPSSGLTAGDVYNVESDGSNYAWTGTEWDKLGATVDLSNYVQKTDYASTSNAGVIKASSTYATNVNNSGVLYGIQRTYAQYVDDANSMFISKGTLENVITGKGLITQYSTMPTASIDNLGKIVQFIGTTDSTYTNGYFYKCVSDGEETPTYSWTQENVQPAPSNVETTTNKVSSITSNSTNVEYASAKAVWDLVSSVGGEIGNVYDTSYAFVFGNNSIGIYIPYNGNTTTSFYYKKNSSSSQKNISYFNPILILYYKDINEIGTPSSNTYFAMVVGYVRGNPAGAASDEGKLKFVRLYVNSSGNIQESSSLLYGDRFFTGEQQLFLGKKTFRTIPEVETYSAPTTNTQLTAKKYVDDSISTVVGNINTVLATLTTPSNNGGGE